MVETEEVEDIPLLRLDEEDTEVAGSWMAGKLKKIIPMRKLQIMLLME
jgi:hypothetical protein